MPLIKHFIKNIFKLKGFLIQVKIRINNKGFRLPTPLKKVAYTGIYLTKKALK